MEERKGFGTNFGFLMASVGSAVGLGNIWGFPNKMGASGGFTFLVVYLVLAVLCGFIVMVGELALGRKTGSGVVSAYHVLSKRFKWLGWLGILSPFFILFFYCALGGYCIKYVVVNVGDLFGASFGSAAFAEVAAANGTSLGAEVFNAFMGNPTEAIIYGLIFVALTMLIVMGGVSGGIEGLFRGHARAVRDAADLHYPRLHPARRGEWPEVHVRSGLGCGQRHHRRSPQFPDRAFHRRRSDVLLPVSGHGHYDHLRLLSG